MMWMELLMAFDILRRYDFQEGILKVLVILAPPLAYSGMMPGWYPAMVAIAWLLWMLWIGFLRIKQKSHVMPRFTIPMMAFISVLTLCTFIADDMAVVDGLGEDVALPMLLGLLNSTVVIYLLLLQPWTWKMEGKHD